MADRFPGGVISKTPPTVVAPVDGEGGSASGVWTLDEVLGYEKAGAWPKPPVPREIYAWGYGSYIGDNTTVAKSSPVQIGALINWAKVSVGEAHTASIKTDGTLWTWGSNGAGSLGDGTTITKSSPVQVGALTNWYQVSAGGNNVVSVKTDGTLWAWGDNYRGQIGDNTTVAKSSPVQVGALTNWAQVSASSYNFCHAVKTDGTLWAWGKNSASGYLGTGDSTSRSSPVQIGALTNWSQVSSGTLESSAVKTDGTLWSWGNNAFGQLGDNTTISSYIPVQIGVLTTWATSSSRKRAMAAIKSSGTLWVWGRNEFGQVGNNTTTETSSPVQVGALTNWAQVSVGSNYNILSVKTDGTLWAWGRNSVGKLGDSTTVNKSSPVQIGALTNWSQVSAGGFNSAAITKG